MRKEIFKVTTADRCDQSGQRTGWVVEMVDGDRHFPFSNLFETRVEAEREAERLREVVILGATTDLPRLRAKGGCLFTLEPKKLKKKPEPLNI